MTDETPQSEVEVEQDAIKDLDVDPAEAEKIKGGRARSSSDPCEGGE